MTEINFYIKFYVFNDKLYRCNFILTLNWKYDTVNIWKCKREEVYLWFLK